MMMVKEMHEISRRGFLALGGAVAAVMSPLRRLAHSSRAATSPSTARRHAEDVDHRDYARHYYSLVGGATVDGFVATTQLDMDHDVGKEVTLVTSLSPIGDGETAGSPSFTGRVATGGVIRHTAEGLENDQHYYCRLTDPGGNVFGDEFRAWTGLDPDPTVSYSLGMILGSCQGNPGDGKSQAALVDARDWADARVFLHLGDWG